MNTGKEIVKEAKKLIGTPYIYGAKYSDGVLTESRLNELRAQNSQVITESYYAVAKRYIGKRCTDCSGLVCWVYGMPNIGSWQLHDKFAKVGLDELKPGMMVWKPGHIGIYIGNNKVIEAKGLAYGTIESDINKTNWSCGLYSTDIIYETKKVDYENLGWNKMDGKWWYATGHHKGDFLKNGIFEIDGAYYAFDGEGYLIDDINKLFFDKKGNIEVK